MRRRIGALSSPQFMRAGECSDLNRGTPDQLLAGWGNCSTTLTPAGTTLAVVASYSGSSTYAPSLTSTHTVSVAKASTSTTVSTTSTSVTSGTSVTYDVTVSPTPAGTAPTGTVTVSVGGTQVCTVTLTSVESGSGSCSSTSAPVGATQSIVAAYGGSADFFSSSGTSSGTLTVTNSATSPPPSPQGRTSAGTTSSTGSGVPPPPPPPTGSTGSVSASSSTPSGTATAKLGDLSATGDGVGSLTIATYSTDPAAVTVTDGTGAYYDVAVATGSAFSSLTIDICPAGTGKSLEWWNGSVWAPFSQESLSGGCLVAVVSTSTTPTLTQLTGTPVAVSGVPITDQPIGSHGYTEAGADGGVFSFGAAAFYGSEGGKHLAAPIVGMAETPTGDGYWLVGADGGVFSFGAAAFYGSEGGKHLAAPIVGLAAG